MPGAGPQPAEPSRSYRAKELLHETRGVRPDPAIKDQRSGSGSVQRCGATFFDTEDGDLLSVAIAVGAFADPVFPRPGKAVNEQPVWSVVCFVVLAEHRGQGVARALLKGAIAYAKEQGATLVEARPVDKSGHSKDDTMWFGAKTMYDQADFQEVARRKPQRPIIRGKSA